MMKKLTQNLHLALTIASAMLIAAGCLNQGGQSAATGSKGGVSAIGGSSGASGSSGTSSSSSKSFTITNVTATNPTGASGASGASGVPTFTLFFNANNLSFKLTDFCSVQRSGGSNNDASKACACRFRWTENNLSSSKAIERTIDTSPTQILGFQVGCPAPEVFNDEIPDNTILKIQFVPDDGKGNTSGFTTNEFLFKKVPITSTGDFRDAEGRAFRNVFHYVCFDKFQKALSIDHRLAPGPINQQTNQAPMLPLANDFVLGTSGGQVSSFSAQSYYYDFYVRSNEIGSINAGNASFTCPQVNIGGVPSFFPLDSTFALALQKSADFSLPVVTQNITIQIGGEAASGTTVGFAAKPNSDGTCPSFTDSAGRIRRTFRLRKYKGIYPIRYSADGDIADQSQPVNIIYVLDRPVDKIGQDPLKPITRLGPKPCPFSFKTAQFGQKCSTDASLAGWNIDGTQIKGNPKCPVYPPPPPEFVKDDGTVVIRPFKPFLSHFLEDTSFKACAFQSSTPIDPEIVLSHDNSVFHSTKGPHNFYCAKHYPPAGAMIPPSNGDPFDKPPGECDLASAAAAIKTDKTYACSRTYDPTNSALNTPAAGCCQICSGANCTSKGGGVTAAGRNAAFNPPSDVANPPQSIRQLPRSIPNQSSGSGCFDPFED